MHVWSLGQEDPLVKEMATHSSIIAGKINGHMSLADYSLWVTESRQFFASGGQSIGASALASVLAMNIQG